MCIYIGSIKLFRLTSTFEESSLILLLHYYQKSICIIKLCDIVITLPLIQTLAILDLLIVEMLHVLNNLCNHIDDKPCVLISPHAACESKNK